MLGDVGRQAAMDLMGVTVKSGATRQVAAAVSSALWRLVVHDGKAGTGREVSEEGEVEQQVLARLEAMKGSITAQVVASRLEGRNHHTARGLVPQWAQLQCNAARHHGFADDFTIMDGKDFKRAQRASSLAKKKDGLNVISGSGDGESSSDISQPCMEAGTQTLAFQPACSVSTQTYADGGNMLVFNGSNEVLSVVETMLVEVDFLRRIQSLVQAAEAGMVKHPGLELGSLPSPGPGALEPPSHQAQHPQQLQIDQVLTVFPTISPLAPSGLGPVNTHQSCHKSSLPAPSGLGPVFSQHTAQPSSQFKNDHVLPEPPVSTLFAPSGLGTAYLQLTVHQQSSLLKNHTLPEQLTSSLLALSGLGQDISQNSWQQSSRPKIDPDLPEHHTSSLLAPSGLGPDNTQHSLQQSSQFQLLDCVLPEHLTSSPFALLGLGPDITQPVSRGGPEQVSIGPIAFKKEDPPGGMHDLVVTAPKAAEISAAEALPEGVAAEEAAGEAPGMPQVTPPMCEAPPEVIAAKGAAEEAAADGLSERTSHTSRRRGFERTPASSRGCRPGSVRHAAAEAPTKEDTSEEAVAIAPAGAAPVAAARAMQKSSQLLPKFDRVLLESCLVLDSGGNISAVLLRQLLASCGHSVKEVDVLIREADVVGDGLIFFEDFLASLSSVVVAAEVQPPRLRGRKPQAAEAPRKEATGHWPGWVDWPA